MKFNVLVTCLLVLLGYSSVANAADVQSEARRVYFDTAKADIKPAEMQNLQLVAEAIKAQSLVVVLVGHADKRGGRLYNLDLGQRRAAAVKAALVSLGVDPLLVDISVSYGKEKPIAPDDMVPCHLATNRSVEILPVDPQTMVVQVETTVVETKEVVKETFQRHRISGLLGFGPYGLTKTVTPKLTTVDLTYRPAFGLGYSVKLNRSFSLGVQAFSNNSYFLVGGVDF